MHPPGAAGAGMPAIPPATLDPAVAGASAGAATAELAGAIILPIMSIIPPPAIGGAPGALEGAAGAAIGAAGTIPGAAGAAIAGAGAAIGAAGATTVAVGAASGGGGEPPG